MRGKVAVLALAMGLVLATVATAKEKLFVDSKEYMEIGSALKLNAGFYEKMIQLDYVQYYEPQPIWVWCAAGYSPIGDPDLSLGKFSYAAAENPLVTEDAKVQQTDALKRAMFHYFHERKSLLKESGGKRAIDVQIVRSERYLSQYYVGWIITADVKISEGDHVLFRAIQRTLADNTPLNAITRWAEDFAKVLRNNEKKLARGFGIDAATATAPTSTTKGTETEKPKDDHAPDF